MDWAGLYYKEVLVPEGYDLFSKNDLSFVQTVFKIFVRHFELNTKLTIKQFLSKGFFGPKVEFCAVSAQVLKKRTKQRIAGMARKVGGKHMGFKELKTGQKEVLVVREEEELEEFERNEKEFNYEQVNRSVNLIDDKFYIEDEIETPREREFAPVGKNDVFEEKENIARDLYLKYATEQNSEVLEISKEEANGEFDLYKEDDNFKVLYKKEISKKKKT